MISVRQQVGNVYVKIDRGADGKWKVEVTDAASRPVMGPERDVALSEVLAEVSSLRAHIWNEELGDD
jgi:hypothetical protein